MALLAAGICTKSGRALVSRQFVEMSRPRIEGLYAAFPKLTTGDKQHTYVETESVRYVYQPIENLYMVLITTKNSNILEDLETLHLFARVIPEYCRSLDEREICDKAFDLIFAFDEIVALGYRESVNIAQIRTFTDMDSHEEKVFQMVQKNKEKEAREEMKRKMKELEQQRRDEKRGRGKVGIPGFGSGFMGGSGSSMGGMGAGSGGGMAGFGGGSAGAQDGYGGPPQYSAPSYDSKPKSGGMKLGSKQKTDDFMSSLMAEGEKVVDTAAPRSMSMARQPSLKQGSGNIEGVHVKIEEKVTLTAQRDGGLEGLEVKGDLILKVSDPESARLRLSLALPDDKPFQYKTHPNCDKRLFTEESVVGLKAPERPFPLNSDQGVLKYRLATTDDTFVPISINCWPSPNATGGSDVNIEYELEDQSLVLEQVLISIPVPSGAARVGSCDGDYTFNNRDRRLEWRIPLIDSSNNAGSMEFSADVGDPNMFFPIHVNFVSSTPFSNIRVAGVQTVDGRNVPFSTETVLAVDSYQIV